MSEDLFQGGVEIVPFAVFYDSEVFGAGVFRLGIAKEEPVLHP